MIQPGYVTSNHVFTSMHRFDPYAAPFGRHVGLGHPTLPFSEEGRAT